MKTKYGIPQKELDEIAKRDTKCVYCDKKMIYPWDKKNSDDSATIEHLNHIQEVDSVSIFIGKGKPVAEIITICCGGCNSSRGPKSLLSWFKEPYCIKNNINENTVAKVVKNYINKYEKGNEKI